MYNNVLGYYLKALFYDFQVFLHCEHLKFSGGVVSRKVGSPKHMQQLQLYTVYSAFAGVFHAFQHLLFAFARQSQNNMANGVDIRRFQPLYRAVITGKRIAAPYIRGGLFVDSLKSEFH